MSHLTVQQRALVAIGASLASNCIPCIQIHVQKGRQAGLTGEVIGEAIEVAEAVRRVPARNVREAAIAALRGEGERASCAGGESACGGVEDALVSRGSESSPCCGPEAGR